MLTQKVVSALRTANALLPNALAAKTRAGIRLNALGILLVAAGVPARELLTARNESTESIFARYNLILRTEYALTLEDARTLEFASTMTAGFNTPVGRLTEVIGYVETLEAAEEGYLYVTPTGAEDRVAA